MNRSAAPQAAGPPVKTVRRHADITPISVPTPSGPAYRTRGKVAVRKFVFVPGS